MKQHSSDEVGSDRHALLRRSLLYLPRSFAQTLKNIYTWNRWEYLYTFCFVCWIKSCNHTRQRLVLPFRASELLNFDSPDKGNAKFKIKRKSLSLHIKMQKDYEIKMPNLNWRKNNRTRVQITSEKRVKMTKCVWEKNRGKNNLKNTYICCCWDESWAAQYIWAARALQDPCDARHDNRTSGMKWSLKNRKKRTRENGSFTRGWFFTTGGNKKWRKTNDKLIR